MRGTFDTKKEREKRRKKGERVVGMFLFLIICSCFTLFVFVLYGIPT